MSRLDLEDALIELCLEHDGLLTSLRDNLFNEKGFNSLKTILKQYVLEIQNDKQIRRDIAGCLRVIETTLHSALFYQNSLQEGDARRDNRIEDAHYEIWEIMNDIFDIKYKP